MTDTDAYHEAHLPIARDFLDQVGAAVLSGGFTQVDALVEGLDDEALTDLLVGLSQRAKVDQLVAGRVAYEHRARTPDGEWGRKVRELAALCEVSDRTIHRWMASYQERAGLEPTPAQANARAAADRASANGDWREAETFQELQEPADPWDDGEEAEAAGFDWGGTGRDGHDGELAMRDAVGEPWAERDSVIPSTRYENPLEQPAQRRAVVAPDETWVAFAAAQLAEEHPALGDQAINRNAKARWDRMVRESPLDLLEDLETIYSGSPPDELVEALYKAEEAKALKPEVVDPGGQKERKPRSGGSPGRVTKESNPRAAAKNVENGMGYAREVYAHISSVQEEGGDELLLKVYGDTLANIQAWAYALDGAMKKIRKAKEDQKLRDKAAAQAKPAAAGDPGF